MIIYQLNQIILNELLYNNINCWIAGGSLRTFLNNELLSNKKYIIQEINDYDIFFNNESDFNKAKDYFLNNNAIIIRSNNNGLKLLYNNNKFDLIKLFFNNPIETIKSFDFTITQIAFDGSNLYYHKDFFDHLKIEKLKINYIEIISKIN